MNDIQKLKYDLAMNCALLETLEEKQEDPTIITRNTMLESFISYYDFYSAMDPSRFEQILNSGKQSATLNLK